LRHFSIVFNVTTATAAVRSSVANWYRYIYIFEKILVDFESSCYINWYDMKNLVYIW